MRKPRHAVFAASTLFITMAYVACIGPGSSSGPAAPGVDASNDDAFDSSAPNADVTMQECNPCYMECPCSPGSQSNLVLGSCMIYTCPASGMWGYFQCVGLGCPEASDEDDTSSDAEPQDGASDAIGPADAPSDVAPTDAPSSDAPSDVATDRAEE